MTPSERTKRIEEAARALDAEIVKEFGDDLTLDRTTPGPLTGIDRAQLALRAALALPVEEPTHRPPPRRAMTQENRDAWDRFLQSQQILADTGLPWLDPPPTCEEMGSVAAAAKMAIIGVMRFRGQNTRSRP